MEPRDLQEARRSRAQEIARPHAVQGDAAGRHRAALPQRILGQPPARYLRRRRLGRAGLQLNRQVRLRHRLAELHETARPREHPGAGGPPAVHVAHRDPLRARRLAPGARLRRRAGADRQALLHELGRAALHPGGAPRGRGLRAVPAALRGAGGRVDTQGVTAAPMRVVNPATGEVLREVAEADRAAVAGAFQRARAAQPAWPATPPAARCHAIRRFRALAVERAEPLARTLALEVGKPITQARSELAGLLPRIDFFFAGVEGALAEEVVLARAADGLEERIRREPLGVVANISAWNYPWYVGANVFLPALLTGNAVLYKPSELATLTGLAIAELLQEAGVPADVFQALVGAGNVGAMLLEERIDAVCFTGSHATGIKVAAAVALRLVKVQLELGGKDPAYVCDDVDAAAAAAAVADGAFYNTGQSCCAVERIYVHERVWEPFGPLIGLARVGSDDEAVALMNDTDFGLTAAVYTPDRARAERLLARVNTGTAYWNCCDRVSPRLPWTGRGASGIGVTLAREGIAAFVRPKAWHLRGG